MKLMIACPYIDPAGASINLRNAINKYTNHKAWQMSGVKTYFNTGDFCVMDVYYKDDERRMGVMLNEIKDTVEMCDLVHLNMLDHTADVQVFEKINGKLTTTRKVQFRWEAMKSFNRFIFHDHGAWLEGRELHDLHRRGKLFNRFDSYGGVVVCNPFSTSIYNGAKWIPNIIPQDDEIYSPVDKDYDGTIYVIQTPSSRRFKGTNILIDIINSLKRRGYPIELKLVEKSSHNLCMRIKRECHITVDSLYDKFPNLASLEAMSQGQVAITKTTDECMDAYNKLGNMEVPVIGIGDSGDLEEKLIYFLDNRDKLKEIGEQGRKWIEKAYADHLLIKRWIKYYKEVLENVN